MQDRAGNMHPLPAAPTLGLCTRSSAKTRHRAPAGSANTSPRVHRAGVPATKHRAPPPRSPAGDECTERREEASCHQSVGLTFGFGGSFLGVLLRPGVYRTGPGSLHRGDAECRRGKGRCVPAAVKRRPGDAVGAAEDVSRCWKEVMIHRASVQRAERRGGRRQERGEKREERRGGGGERRGEERREERREGEEGWGGRRGEEGGEERGERRGGRRGEGERRGREVEKREERRGGEEWGRGEGKRRGGGEEVRGGEERGERR
ncbi:unnamed protein product [Pleuronectes platessa]|uniref:Uncharacterized protein n=1 Tax=Pleuronectes platessa TaxID=8262 RepID=A0A9N7U5C0_PLEPL|nr:unnamed protein product [Pleuronectes platessa]